MLNPKTAAQQGMVEELFGEQRPGHAARVTAAAPAAAPAPDPEPEDLPPLERRCYCILRGRFHILPTVELRNRQRQERWFDWDDITGGNLDDPGRLVLHVQRGGEAYTVTIAGRFLDRELAPGIRAKRVAWIHELDELAAAAVARADPAEPAVTGIHIVKGSASSEWSRGAAGHPGRAEG
jgi:hypothetical protein